MRIYQVIIHNVLQLTLCEFKVQTLKEKCFIYIDNSSAIQKGTSDVVGLTVKHCALCCKLCTIEYQAQ